MGALLKTVQRLAQLLPRKSPISQNSAPFDEMGALLEEISESRSQPFTQGETLDAEARLSHATCGIARVGSAAAVMVQGLAQQHSIEAEEEFAIGVAAEEQFDQVLETTDEEQGLT